MFGDRRKTAGSNFGLSGRPSTAITPTKRFTDLGGAASVRKMDSRLSMGQNSGQPRLSIFQRGSALAPRDVKQSFSTNVSKIYNFLLENEGVGAPPEKTIRSPCGKNDFIQIFEQLYQHLSKDYEFPQGARVEDEFTQIFKGLGYPFPLKNSFFQPMGSSHGYPHLLDALAWLIEMIQTNQAVSADTQNILLGDFMEPAAVQEKILSYSWLSSTFKEYTLDRKATESMTGPFWLETKTKLRHYMENFDEIGDMTTSSKNALEQLRFECEEIAADKGSEQSLIEEIARIKDDIRKAQEYLESTERVKKQAEIELGTVRSAFDARKLELEAVQAEVDELKERIEVQKQRHGLTGKEVRQLNLENNRDKETVTEIQTELDKLSKIMWRLRDEDSFKQQKANFVHLVENIEKIMGDVGVKLDDLKPLGQPRNEKELKTYWETLNNIWITEVNRRLKQKKLELDTEKKQFSSRFAVIEERLQMQRELLEDESKKERREERVRRNEREEWKADRLQREKRYDELENEKEVLAKQMQMDGSLEREIEEEKKKGKKTIEELKEKETSVENSIRQKLEKILHEVSQIESAKMMFHVKCTELEKMVLNCRDNSN